MLAVPLSAAGRTDVLILENGDRLTGEVKTLERGELSFKSDVLGTLGVEWGRVRSVESSNSFDVECSDGSRYFGTLERGSEAELLVAGEGEPVPLPLAQVVRIRRIRKSFWARLDGSLGLGANYSSADSTLQLNLSAEARTRNLNVERSLSASWIATRQENVPQTSSSELSWTQVKLLPQRRLLQFAGRLQRNDELGIDLRGLVLAGYGRRFVQTNRVRLVGIGGVALNIENSTAESSNESSLEGLLGMRYEYFRSAGLDRDATLEVIYYPSLQGESRHRLEIKAALLFELVKDFGLRFDLVESHDSRPPAGAVSKKHVAGVISVVWSY